jgi:hypothetical protein
VLKGFLSDQGGIRGRKCRGMLLLEVFERQVVDCRMCRCRYCQWPWMHCEANLELRMNSSTRINKRGFQRPVSFLSTMKCLGAKKSLGATVFLPGHHCFCQRLRILGLLIRFYTDSQIRPLVE